MGRLRSQGDGCYDGKKARTWLKKQTRLIHKAKEALRESWKVQDRLQKQWDQERNEIISKWLQEMINGDSDMELGIEKLNNVLAEAQADVFK